VPPSVNVPELRQIELLPVISAEFPVPKIPTVALESTTLPPALMVRVLLEPALPTGRFALLLQRELLPVMSAELPLPK
jgi:hypothetical protein